MLLGIERVYVDATESVQETDFEDVASPKILAALKDGKVWIFLLP
jgi:hypothetical protein